MSLNRTGIDWCTHTLNPLWGCKHTTKKCACSEDCYANAVAGRYPHMGEFREPVSKLDRLKCITPDQKAMVIFIGSMTDMMGEWWTKEQIQAVIDKCAQCPKHIFMWLTKNPDRYADFKWPENCWLGTTVTGIGDHYREEHLNDLSWLQTKRFISYEPILAAWQPKRSFDWIIAGAMTKNSRLNPDYQVYLPEILTLKRHAPLLVKSPLSTYPGHKQFPPEIKKIMDTWSK